MRTHDLARLARAIGIEGERAAGLDRLEPGLLAAVDEALADPPVDAEHEVERVGTETGDLHDLRHASRVEAPQARAGLDVFEREHGSPPKGVDHRLPAQKQSAIGAGWVSPVKLAQFAWKSR